MTEERQNRAPSISVKARAKEINSRILVELRSPLPSSDANNYGSPFRRTGSGLYPKRSESLNNRKLNEESLVPRLSLRRFESLDSSVTKPVSFCAELSVKRKELGARSSDKTPQLKRREDSPKKQLLSSAETSEKVFVSEKTLDIVAGINASRNCSDSEFLSFEKNELNLKPALNSSATSFDESVRNPLESAFLTIVNNSSSPPSTSDAAASSIFISQEELNLKGACLRLKAAHPRENEGLHFDVTSSSSHHLLYKNHHQPRTLEEEELEEEEEENDVDFRHCCQLFISSSESSFPANHRRDDDVRVECVARSCLFDPEIASRAEKKCLTSEKSVACTSVSRRVAELESACKIELTSHVLPELSSPCAATPRVQPENTCCCSSPAPAPTPSSSSTTTTTRKTACCCCCCSIYGGLSSSDWWSRVSAPETLPQREISSDYESCLSASDSQDSSSSPPEEGSSIISSASCRLASSRSLLEEEEERRNPAVTNIERVLPLLERREEIQDENVTAFSARNEDRENHHHHLEQEHLQQQQQQREEQEQRLYSDGRELDDIIFALEKIRDDFDLTFDDLWAESVASATSSGSDICRNNNTSLEEEHFSQPSDTELNQLENERTLTKSNEICVVSGAGGGDGGGHVAPESKGFDTTMYRYPESGRYKVDNNNHAVSQQVNANNLRLSLVPQLASKSLQRVPFPERYSAPNSPASTRGRFSNHSSSSWAQQQPSTRIYNPSVRAKPELPSYLTLGRRGANVPGGGGGGCGRSGAGGLGNVSSQRVSNNNERFGSCEQLHSERYNNNALEGAGGGGQPSGEVSLIELQRIRNILANLDFSKFKRGTIKSRSTNDSPTERLDPNGRFVKRSLSATNAEYSKQQLVRKISFGKTTENNNCGGGSSIGGSSSKLKELTEKLKPSSSRISSSQTAPSSPNLIQGSSSNNHRFFSPALRSSSYSNFRVLPLEGAGTIGGHMSDHNRKQSQQTQQQHQPVFFPANSFQENLRNNPLVRATATLPRRKMGVSGSPSSSSTSAYSLLPSKSTTSQRNDYLNLETPQSSSTAFFPSSPEPVLYNRSVVLDSSPPPPPLPVSENAYDDVYDDLADPETRHNVYTYQRSISECVEPSRSLSLRRITPKFSAPTFSTRTCGGVPVPERRKRRKALLGATTLLLDSEPVTPEPEPEQQHEKKNVTGRSLTYPLQKKTGNGGGVEPQPEEDRFRSLTRGSKAIASLRRDETYQQRQKDQRRDEEEEFRAISYGEELQHDYEGSENRLSVDDRNNKSFKKKHHSDPGTDQNLNFSELVSSGSKSEPDLGDETSDEEEKHIEEEEEEEDGGRRGGGPKNSLRRETPSRSISCYGNVSRHLRYGSDGGGALGGEETGGLGCGSITPTSGGTLPSFFGSGDLDSFSKSPQQQRRYSKKRLRGPYGEMLEEEMRKSGEKQKQTSSCCSSTGELGFLKDIPENEKGGGGGVNNEVEGEIGDGGGGGIGAEEGSQSAGSSRESDSSGGDTQRQRHQMLTTSQSLDNPDLKRSNSTSNASITAGQGSGSGSVSPKRKISANLPFLSQDSASAFGSVTTTTSEPNLARSLGRKDKLLPYIGNVSRASANGATNSANNNNNNETRPLTRWSGGVKGQQLLEVVPVDKNDVGIKFSDTRTHVVGELYDTERSYVESLQILVNKYMKPLKSSECSGMVESGLVDEIFYQIPEILTHHETFLEALRLRLTAWDSKQKIGDVFVEAFTKQPIVDTYTAFINNWKSAKEAIKLASQAKPAFAKFLEHMCREHKGKLTLDALLIMPVQRIPRYELLIKELVKHTQLDHPDHHLLISAQREVHDLAVKINRVEREAFQHEQMQQRVKDIEHLIEGVLELVQPDRTFIRYDMVAIPGGLGTKKERCFFLFSDLLLITSMKRKSGTIRKSSSTSGSPSPFSTMEMNKYKLLMRFSLDNLDIAKCTDGGVKKAIKEIESLEEDLSTLNQLMEIALNLRCQHQSLDEVLKDLINSLNKQLVDKQTTDSQLLSLDLTVTTQEGVDNLTIIFPNAEKRASWEETFNEAKQKLALSTDRRPPPEFMYPLPIRKTRAGLQFTCSACTLGLNGYGLKDVWVCNSDGYVGQVCVLSLQPEPTVTSCNGVCNARILCAMSIPAATPFYLSSRRKSLLPDSSVSISIRVEDTDLDESQSLSRPNNGNFQLDSDSSDEDEESVDSPDEDCKNQGSDGSKEEKEEMDNMQPTMWLGTEDGCIHVYNCSDNIRIKKNKMKIQHSAAVHCIIYLDNRVFVSLANGELVIYRKDLEGGWNTVDVQRVTVGSSAAPVMRMLPVAGKLWCGCQNTIKVLNTMTLEIEMSFQVSSDSSRPVICMVTSGLGVWIAIQHSSVVRLFHATSYESLLDVNVAPAVTKMLSGCDDIIRQHKAACLRVSALLACKDLLWVGTSAGVILTLPLPHLTSTTTKLDNLPNVAGVPHGHTGHVRFMTSVEMSPLLPLGCSKFAHRSIRSKEGLAARRASTVTGAASAGYKLLVISGGDGYEDFRSSGVTEAAGRDDSTNHLLLWQV